MHKIVQSEFEFRFELVRGDMGRIIYQTLMKPPFNFYTIYGRGICQHIVISVSRV